MAKPPLPHQEVERIVRALEPLSVERRIVLVGGQAVAFWMRFLGPKTREPRLADPLTSKDIDFEGSAICERVGSRNRRRSSRNVNSGLDGAGVNISVNTTLS